MGELISSLHFTMSHKQDGVPKSSEDGVSAFLRDTTHKADIVGTRMGLTDITAEGDPNSLATSYVKHAKELMRDDGTPVLQEHLEEALKLLSVASSLETTQEIIDLRAKVDYALLRIENEEGTRTHPFSPEK